MEVMRRRSNSLEARTGLRVNGHATEKKWWAAIDIAARQIESDPEDPQGWVNLSYALHRLKRTTEARDSLLRVVDAFAFNANMRYDLARYECQLGRLEQAKAWLEEAFALGDARDMKRVALDDPDLRPLWKNIGRN